MNSFYRLGHLIYSNIVGNKTELQKNQAENDGINEFSTQTRKERDLNDPDYYNNGTQQKLILENKEEKSALIGELNKMKERYNELKQSLNDLKDELTQEKKNSQKLKKHLENEKRDVESKLKTSDEKVRKLEGALVREKNNSQNFKQLKNEKRESDLKLKTLNEIVRNLDSNLLQERQKYENLNEKLTVLKENYQQNINQLKDHYNELESAKENMETNMGNNIKNLEQQLREERINFHQKFKQAHEKYKKNINEIRQKLDEKGNGLRDLEDENAKLKQEASKYQSALGVATNTRLDDGDQNHSVKLKNDIVKLQNALENYVTHLKPNMDLNIKEIQKLAQEYGCLNEITTENPNKIFIKAILIRKVLDIVRNFSFVLIKFQGETYTLESDIELKANELLRLIKLFSSTRAGIDEITDASIIKIRQQVFGILGNRGFNNIIDDDGNMRTHDFIAYVSNELNEMMNHYRKINDLDRKEQVNAMAPKLVQDIFKLFWFRINVQEPKTECEFFENDIINPNLMKGIWNDDEIDKLRVDICYFPLVGSNLNSSDAKIYTLAKVYPRNVSGSNEPDEEKYE